jgi:aminoglycoside phosphotransferase (APT) family kinase protein
MTSVHLQSSSIMASTAEEVTIAEGAEPAIVGPLLAEAMCDIRWAHCSVALISGGKSNLTYRVRSDAGEVILRRPPLGHVLPTAHDMGREYRVLTALHDTPVPVPRTFYLGSADSALGAPFYVMERVVGHICRDALPPGYATTVEERGAIGAGLIDVLAALHTVDPDQVGLGDFGRPRGFMERQLRRWSEQWQRSKTADLPTLDALRDRLADGVPTQQRAAVVHGDYRLDNALLHPSRRGEIVAVLDWEMSTLGDPLADLGAMLAYWSEADDDEVLVRARMFGPVTAEPGFPSRADVVERYARATGLDGSAISWYQAFAFFKLAVICQGIALRAAGGAMLGSGFDDAQGLVEPLVAAGHHHLGRREPRGSQAAGPRLRS